MRVHSAIQHISEATRVVENEAARMKFLRHKNASNSLQGIVNELKQLKDRLEQAAANAVLGDA